MLYLEDDNNVRPSWMPHKNDYRLLDIAGIITIEDCDEAIVWLSGQLTILHGKAAANTNPDHDKFYRYHMAQCHCVKDKVHVLKSQYWREDVAEQKAQEAADKAERRAKHDAMVEACRKMKQSASYKAEKALAHQRYVEGRAVYNQEMIAWIGEFRKVFTERYSDDLYMTMATEARSRVEANKPQGANPNE